MPRAYSDDLRSKLLKAYAADFNPIEQACSKLKQLLRGVKARIVALHRMLDSGCCYTAADVRPALEAWMSSEAAFRPRRMQSGTPMPS